MNLTVSDEEKEKIINQIELFKKAELFQVGRPGLSENEERLYSYLTHLEFLLREKNEIPPLLLLEIFLCTHGTKHPPLPFVLDWLYKGALEFHQAEGQEHFEIGLGFTVGRGANSGQGHEFKTARRNNFLQRDQLYFWIRCLYKFEGYSVDGAVEIVHSLHKRQLSKSKRKVRQPIEFETLKREYKAWKGKTAFDDNEKDIFKAWAEQLHEWMNLFRTLEQEGITLPTPRKKVKPIR